MQDFDSKTQAPETPATTDRRFIIAMTLYVVLGILAYFLLQDEALYAVLFCLVVLALKTYLVVLKARQD